MPGRDPPPAPGTRSRSRRCLFIPSHIHPAPQHVDARSPRRMLSQAILAPLRGDLCKILHPNFYEKALFVKADLAASSRPSAAAGPFALCFYSHSRGAHILLVARCIG
jgi:hypothetical protein